MKRTNPFLAVAILAVVLGHCLPNASYTSGDLDTALAYNRINESPRNYSAMAASAVVGPWVTQDIGDTALAGNAVYNNGTFTVSASGVDLYNTSDGFRYVYQPLNGDGEIIARVATVQNNYEWAQAGVMIRESLTANSRHASMLVTPSGRAKFRRRYVVGGDTTSDGPGAGSITIPQWVKLVRQGNAFTGYISTDGTGWTPIGDQATPVTMIPNVYVGMFVTSWTNTELNTSTFDNVLATAANPPADTTPPAVNVTAPLSGATVSGAAATASATASDGVGVVGVQFKLDGNNLGSEDTTSPYSIAWNTTTVINGSHSITAVARDAAGNINTSTAINFVVSNTPPDTTPPTVSITSPSNNVTVSGASVTVSATAGDNVGVTGVQFKVDGNNLASEDNTLPYSVSWDSTTVANGSHQLTAVARDASGNSATSGTVTITTSNILDTTPPMVNITSPASNTTVSGAAVIISAEASDDVRVAGVQFKLDGTSIGAEVTTAPYTVSWNTTTTTNASHTLAAIARDAAGNAATSAAVSVITDNVQLPTVSFSANPTSITVGGSSTLSWATTNAATVSIDQGIGTVVLNGSLVVMPASNTTYTLTATNSGGSVTGTAAVAVSPPTPIPASDEFNSTTLDSSWSFINPRNDSSYSLNATAGHLQLNTPGTVVHQCWGSKDPAVTCVRMTRPVTNADAVYETRLSGSALTTGFMKYGIMLQQDSANFMRFEFATLSGSKIVAQGWNITNGNGSNTIAGPAVTLQAYNYLRLTKSGGKFKLEYSGDGTTWQLAGEILVPGFAVNQAGLFVSNSGNTPAVTANFDYWRVTLQSPNDTIAPAAPTGVNAGAVSANRINLSWQPVTDNIGVTGYNIYRNGTLIGTSTATSFADTSLVPATTYTYTVTAVDAAGNASGQSPSVMAVTAPVSSVSPMQLKLLVWNIQQCETTEGVCDVNKQAQAMAQSNPDIIALSEVLQANVSQYISALNQLMPGVIWYQHFGKICPLATCNGGDGQGQLLLSRIQPSSTSIKYFSGADRSAEAMVFNNLNGKKVAVVVTHLASNGWDAEDASPLRANEMDEMKAWARGLAPLQILAGDFNTSPVRMYNGEPEINRIIMDGYADAWQQAMNRGSASGFGDNPTGGDIRTLRARIDYMFYSSSPALNVLSAAVIDSRDLTNTNVAYNIDTPDDKAVKPSDHNKLEVILSISGGALPTVNSFAASPTGIGAGQSSTLSWTTSNATTVSIDQGIGSVAASGSVTVSPASTTTYTLTATNSEGSTTAARVVTVAPPPAITSLAPVSGTSAGGTVVTISGTGFAQGASVKFDGVSATGVTVNSAASITATSPAHAVGTVSVSVTNLDAQTGSKSNAFTYALPAPSAPTNLTAVASTTANQVTLSWTDTSANESAFKVERCTGANCTNFSQIIQVGANVTSYANTGLASNTSYRYRVRASNSSGDSAYSNVVTVKTRR